MNMERDRYRAVPFKYFSQYLTDGVGNDKEIEPKFELVKNITVDSAVMGVIVVDSDAVSFDLPLIPKGKDGNAK